MKVKRIVSNIEAGDFKKADAFYKIFLVLTF